MVFLNMILIRQPKKNKKEDNNYEIQRKHRGKQPNQTEKTKKVKKSIAKSIKMQIFCIFIICN